MSAISLATVSYTHLDVYKRQEKASPVGLAIDRNQPEYLAWLRQVAVGMKTRLDADEMRIIEQTP